MKENKNARVADSLSVTISIRKNGEDIELSLARKQEILKCVEKILNPEESCYMWEFKDDAALFLRAKKPKRFTPAEALAIKSAPGSIRQKAKDYKASTKTIHAIMNDRY